MMIEKMSGYEFVERCNKELGIDIHHQDDYFKIVFGILFYLLRKNIKPTDIKSQ